MKWGIPEFGAQMIRIVMSSLLIIPVIRVKFPSLSLPISFNLKPIFLSDIRIATRACFLIPFA